MRSEIGVVREVTARRRSKSVFRRVNEWLHLWLGLASGIVVFVVCITGAVWVFNEEITYLVQPAIRAETQPGPVLKPSQVLAIAQRAYPGEQASYAYYQQGTAIRVGVGERTLFLNPYTGQVQGVEMHEKGESGFFEWILLGHRYLWLPQEIGRPVVNYGTLVFITLLVTGLIWWYPAKWTQSARKKSFGIKWKAGWKRLNVDLHNVPGFYALLVLLALSVTGVVFGLTWFGQGLYRLTSGGDPEPEWKRVVSDTTQQGKLYTYNQAIDQVWAGMVADNDSEGGFYYAFPDSSQARSTISMRTYPSAGRFYDVARHTYDRHTLRRLEFYEVFDKSFEESSVAARLRRMNYDIHIGTIWGLPGKILAFLASLIGASLPVTGFIVWWNRKGFGKKIARYTAVFVVVSLALCGQASGQQKPGNQRSLSDTSARDLQEHVVSGKTEATQVKELVFAVDVLDLKAVAGRNLEINRLLDAMPGIRVRETGGMGSEFNYAIHGLSGKSVRFFVDGVPMEAYGSGYSIQNFPVNSLERIEVYKGVTPIELSGDALGGSINLITRKDLGNFLDVSYSIGSFQTHKAELSGKWRRQNGLTFQLSSSYRFSENNYKVWGQTVEVADEFGKPIAGKKYRRFNDDFRAFNIKAEIGITGKPWADALMLGVIGSDMDKGVQTGRTMAFVYGQVRYDEKLLAPSIRYSKRNANGLSVDVYGVLNRMQAQTTDTSSRKYNWAQTVIAQVAGELNGIRAQKSAYRFKDRNAMLIANASYALGAHHKLAASYSWNRTNRTGSDPLATAEWTIPFREPQELNRHVAALSYQTVFWDEKLTNVLFVKNFGYSARTNVYNYNGGEQKELIPYFSENNRWGAGFGSKFRLNATSLVKLSVESAARMPDGVELLGNGNTILNAPGLKPEKSTNLNTGIAQSFRVGEDRWGYELGLFYRNTRDLIWLGEGDLYGTARYENIDKLRSAGADLAMRYARKKWLEINASVTYQDVRNRQRYTASGAKSIVFNDRMKNLPSLMANGEIRFKIPSVFGSNGDMSIYAGTDYVHGFFLSWPSLGDRSTKKRIPTQFLQNTGITYSFLQNSLNVSLECRNILDKQVYDNYLLQKPGRFISLNIRCFLHNQ
nr:PepSY domain-containing protein [uncultured Dyadobacter sp.]